MDVESSAVGRWPSLDPWLHTYSLPVFALIAVAVACAWRFASWLHDVEDYVERTFARVRRILTDALASPRQPRRPSRRLRAAPPLRPRLRVTPASPDRLTRGQVSQDPRESCSFDSAREAMETPFVRSYPATLTRRYHRVAHVVSLVGPAIAAAGVIWAILQPYRLTLLHPRGAVVLVARRSSRRCS